MYGAKQYRQKFCFICGSKNIQAKSYGESIRENLENYNTTAKLKQDAPLRCSCNDILIFALEEKCGYLFGHAWIKGEDVKDDLL